MIHTKYIFSIISFLLVSSAYAQLQILTKSSDQIKIRWVPSSPQEWDLGNKYGYTLTKETIGKNNKVEGKPEVFTFKMASEKEWDAIIEKSEYGKIPKGYFYEDPILPGELSPDEHKNALAGRMIFVMFTADMSFDVAQGLALAYIDKDVKPKKKYKYTVSINHPSALKSKTSTYASLEDQYLDLPPLNLEDLDYVDSTVNLKWKVNPYVQHSAYIVEKSSDRGVSFQAVDEVPYLPLANGEDLSEIVYGVKIDTLFKNYIFRVRGIDPFGELSQPSKAVEVFAFNSKIPAPDGLSEVFPNQNSILLSWDFPSEENINIKGFNVYRRRGDQEMRLDNKTLIDKENRLHLGEVDVNDQNIVYYLAAVDLRDRETLSAPYIVTVVDSIAPQKVRNLMGTVDSLGVVTITWTEPEDKDVFSYDILRAEGNLTNDFIPVAQVPKGSTMVTDTLTLGKGTFPYVYYQIVPSDHYINYTEDNEWLKIVRPDVEAPFPPQIAGILYTDTTVTLEFLPSFSDDVEKYILYKVFVPDSVKIHLATFPADSLIYGYVDVAADEEVPVKYILEAVDFSGLSSKDACNYTFKMRKPFNRPAVKNLEVKYNKTDKVNELNWTYNDRGRVSQYWVFKFKEGDYRKVASLPSNIRTWVDTDIVEKTEYTYYIYAVWNDDTRSKTDAKVTVYTK